MKEKEIIAKINEYIPVKQNLIKKKRTVINEITFENVRDRLIGLGTILEENFDEFYYVLNVPSGFANKNAAVVLVLWENANLNIYAYSKEGIINQNTSAKAIEQVVKRIVR